MVAVYKDKFMSFSVFFFCTKGERRPSGDDEVLYDVTSYAEFVEFKRTCALLLLVGCLPLKSIKFFFLLIIERKSVDSQFIMCCVAASNIEEEQSINKTHTAKKCFGNRCPSSLLRNLEHQNFVSLAHNF